MRVGGAVLWFLFMIFTRADIPENYILQITPICGADGDSDGRLEIVTDLNADAKAICKDNVEVPFTTTDNVNYILPFSYQGGSGNQQCVFVKRADTKVYAAMLMVSYGEPGSLIHQYTEEYTVTCTFDRKGEDYSATHTLDETLIAAKVIQKNMGNMSESTVTLQLVDVIGNDLAGETIGLGRIIQLSATLTGTEVGIRPVSCDALDSIGSRYAVLRAGCGDGIVFQKDDGFTTLNTTTVSPYFEAFSINVDSTLSFECNFSLCISECNGDSCAVEAPVRRRRGTARVELLVTKYAVANTVPVSLLGIRREGVGTVQRTTNDAGGVGTVQRTTNRVGGVGRVEKVRKRVRHI